MRKNHHWLYDQWLHGGKNSLVNNLIDILTVSSWLWSTRIVLRELIMYEIEMKNIHRYIIIDSFYIYEENSQHSVTFQTIPDIDLGSFKVNLL
jgi:hypothetical protein